MRFNCSISHLLAFWYLLICAVNATVLHTQSRWIVDENNKRVKFRCVNWGGHMEVNIPEGLQHQPVEKIVDWIAKNGFNCVRLTFSIDMALNPSIKVSDSFTWAAGGAGVSVETMQGIYKQVVSKNPWIESTNTLGAFARVIDELRAKNILVVLDNHVSRAKWCCVPWDGNGWWDEAFGYNKWNSEFFNTQNWLKGLREMALFSKNHPNVVGIGLRNELRTWLFQRTSDWYKFIAMGADAVHQANKDLLIIMGGTDSSGNMEFLRSRPFDRSPYPNKVVWEFHNYQWFFPVVSGSCTIVTGLLGWRTGFVLEQNQPNTGPLWLSEFGWNQNSPSNDEVTYYKCLVEYMENNDADWAYWALMGSYYVRDGEVNKDESFGLLNRDWSGWRNPAFVQNLGKMWQVTQGP